MKPHIAIIGVKGLPGHGGSSKANENILRNLSNKYDFTLMVLDSYAKEENYYGINQIIIKSWKNKKLSSLFLYLRSFFHVLFTVRKYDLVHLNHGFNGFMVPILKMRYPTILTLRGLIYDNDDKWGYIEKLVFKLFQKVAIKTPHLLTTVQKSSLYEINKIRLNNTFYIPNGVEDNFINTPDCDVEDVICFAAARIYYLKGCHDLLEALIKIGYNGKVRIIGDLEQVSSYKNKILALSEHLNIEFCGLIHDSKQLYSLIKSSRLFIFPSYSEGMSNMLLEVASLKVPIIASDIQPNKDVFNNNEVTYFSKGDVNDLSEKIKMSLNNIDLIQNKAEKAYERVRREYSWGKVCESYDLCYQKLLKKKV